MVSLSRTANVDQHSDPVLKRRLIQSQQHYKQIFDTAAAGDTVHQNNSYYRVDQKKCSTLSESSGISLQIQDDILHKVEHFFWSTL